MGLSSPDDQFVFNDAQDLELFQLEVTADSKCVITDLDEVFFRDQERMSRRELMRSVLFHFFSNETRNVKKVFKTGCVRHSELLGKPIKKVQTR